MDGKEAKIIDFVFDYLNYVAINNLFDSQKESCKEYYKKYIDCLEEQIEIEKQKYNELEEKMAYSSSLKRLPSNKLKFI